MTTETLWQRHKRLLIGIMAMLVALLGLCCMPLSATTRMIIAYDTGVVVYLALVFRLMAHHSRAKIPPRALEEDEGTHIILLLTIFSTLICLIAIVREMIMGSAATGTSKFLHILLAVATIVLSWLFTQVMFALHYALLYYRDKNAHLPPCLIFPEQHPQPDYWDFLYVACSIGTSGQTADVMLASPPIRRLGTLHCVLAFFYNAAILALMINIAAGLLA